MSLFGLDDSPAKKKPSEKLPRPPKKDPSRKKRVKAEKDLADERSSEGDDKKKTEDEGLLSASLESGKEEPKPGQMAETESAGGVGANVVTPAVFPNAFRHKALGLKLTLVGKDLVSAAEMPQRLDTSGDVPVHMHRDFPCELAAENIELDSNNRNIAGDNKK